MTKFLKVIGLVLWSFSGMMLVMGLMVIDLKGTNTEVFDVMKWAFAITFVGMSPWYLVTIFSNTLFLSEKGILELRRKLNEAKNSHDEMTKLYLSKVVENSKTLNDMMIFIKYKDKSQRIKEIDELFDNKPMTDEIRELRYKMLKYIQNNG